MCNDGKKKKYAFKANTPEETRSWAMAINKFTNNLDENVFYEQESDESEEIVQPKKGKKIQPLDNENLFEAFHSRLFVDDNDLNVKVNTLNEIRDLFNLEKKALESMIQDDEKYKPIKKQVQSISNLSNTMDTLISNLIEEVDDSRS